MVPCDLIKAFAGDSIYEIEDDINEWIENNPEYYLDKFEMTAGAPGYKSVLCDFCLRDDLEDEEKEKEGFREPTVKDYFKGLIGAVNELTDAVKQLTKEK